MGEVTYAKIKVGNQNGNSSPQQQFAVRTEEVNTDQGESFL